jgi:hypothetical protein
MFLGTGREKAQLYSVNMDMNVISELPEMLPKEDIFGFIPSNEEIFFTVGPSNL